ncbi:MAG TPA: hypothetical protein PLT66_00185 [Bacillota bacterium]|nr:hypothetical protein [Bacillota bacterium]
MSNFKAFFKENSSLIAKFFITQISINVFSLVIAIAMRMVVHSYDAPKTLLYVLSGLAGTFFFWFLIHDYFWQRGAKDHIMIEAGHLKRDVWKGLKVGAVALLPTLVLTLVYVITYLIAVPTQSVVIGSINAVVTLPLFYLFDGMYYSFFSLAEGSYALPFVVLGVSLLSLAFPTLAYYLGSHEKKLRSFVGLENVDLPEKKNQK